MLPLGDDNSRRRLFPLMTYLLIAANIVFFIFEFSAGDDFIIQWAFVPARFLDNPLGQLPTIFSAMFLHAGWAHLLGNMLYLLIFGDNVEDRLGHFKFLIFYFLCGIVATFAQFAINPASDIPNLGASGAVAGILGAYLIMFPQGRVRVLLFINLIQLPAIVVIGFWILLQFFSGLDSVTSSSITGGVAYMAHIGGFLAGLLLTFLMGGNRRDHQTIHYS
jgi:membrane associated rhomboid family serine protease